VVFFLLISHSESENDVSFWQKLIQYPCKISKQIIRYMTRDKTQ